MSGLCWCDTTATSFNFSLLQYTNPSMHQHRSLHKNCTNSWVPTRVVPVPRPVSKNGAVAAKNVCIDTGEYPSRCTDPIPGHLEIGPCYFPISSVSSVSSASKQVPWVSLRELTDTQIPGNQKEKMVLDHLYHCQGVKPSFIVVIHR